MQPLLLTFPGNESLGSSLRAQLGFERVDFELRHFPDGETFIRIDSDVAGRDLVLLSTLDHPDSKVLPITLVAETARDLGASRVGLVAPYLPYMRQDIRFHPGEGVTSVYFARLLSRVFDWLVTVDPHLHRYATLEEIYSIPALSLRAAPLIAAWVAHQVENPVFIGPDRESIHQVGAVANLAGAPFLVLEKQRCGDRAVTVSQVEAACGPHHTPVLVDDIISTGRTLIETLRSLRDRGYPPALCVGVHAVFADDPASGHRTSPTVEALLAAGAGRVVTCNTIPHATNELDISPLLAEGIRSLIRGIRVDEG